jgi:hypothetical protein
MIPSRSTGGRAPDALLALALVGALASGAMGRHALAAADPWAGDLRPITAKEWSPARASHLLERAGFGGTPEEVAALARLTPEQAVEQALHAEPGPLPPFDPSGIHDPSLEPFPPSRPATTALARERGEAIGVRVKAGGDRPLQPVVNRFFYWLRASALETHRLAYWWAQRMLVSKRPLQEKVALFWHGHFAVHETKVRDYRKLERQLELFHRLGTGSFRELLHEVARDPAMLVFLDAGQNVKGAPNENFAREIMELFTMGPGHYTETDIREAARAFTGWNYRDLEFAVNVEQHDDGEKTVLGKRGRFDGDEVIDLVLEQPATAEFIAAKLYRFFVREELSAELRSRLGVRLRESDYRIEPLLRTIFLSRDFYSRDSRATQIKSPVHLVISTYRKLGLREIPGVPDFNQITAELGQQLFWPPTVAGWPEGRAWVTPGLLMARGNFAYRVLSPDINFVPPDRSPPDPRIGAVHRAIAQGQDITSATLPGDDEGMAMANVMADRDEDFNTRYGSYKGWQQAIQRVKPIPRVTAAVDLRGMVLASGARTAEQAVDHLLGRFLLTEPDPELRRRLIAYLEGELGTGDLTRAESYLEEPLRGLVHLILSAPEYQLG